MRELFEEARPINDTSETICEHSQGDSNSGQEKNWSHRGLNQMYDVHGR
jgi:hypothetical protein